MAPGTSAALRGEVRKKEEKWCLAPVRHLEERCGKGKKGAGHWCGAYKKGAWHYFFRFLAKFRSNLHLRAVIGVVNTA